MKRFIQLSLSLVLFASFTATAADRSTYILQVQTNNGAEQRVVSAEWRNNDGFQNPCGATLKYGGIADDGVRVINCDGSGSYVDGARTGRLKWGYALSPDDKNKLRVKTFNEWRVDMIESDSPAAMIYIEFVDGPLTGKSIAEVLGVNNGAVALSPYYFGKK